MIRVVIAEEHPAVLAGLAALLQDRSDVRLAGMTSSRAAAITVVRAAEPDVVVASVPARGPLAAEFARKLIEAGGASKVIMLSATAMHADIRRLSRVGVRGFVLRRAAADSLLPAIRAVAEGLLFIDAGFVQGGLRPSGGWHSPRMPLDLDDLTILRAVARGLSAQEIASQLAISADAAEARRLGAMDKLGVRSRAAVKRLMLSWSRTGAL